MMIPKSRDVAEPTAPPVQPFNGSVGRTENQVGNENGFGVMPTSSRSGAGASDSLGVLKYCQLPLSIGMFVAAAVVDSSAKTSTKARTSRLYLKYSTSASFMAATLSGAILLALLAKPINFQCKKFILICLGFIAFLVSQLWEFGFLVKGYINNLSGHDMRLDAYQAVDDVR